MNERSRHPLDYVAILSRRKAWLGVPLLVSTALSIALALLLPPTYRSTATIAVQAPAMVPDLVPARAALDRTERLRAISQQLLSRPVLERVVREEGAAGDRPLEVVTQDLMSRVSVEIPRPITRTQGEPELNAFNIVYRDRTAESAHRVASRLAHVFTEEHSRSREIQAEGTAEFLATQVAATQQRLLTLEKQLRSAKELHMGRLPDQTLANLQIVAGVRQQLESTQNGIRSEQDRLVLTDRQIQSMRRGLGAPSVASPSQGPSPMQRVAALEGQLAEARAKYTEKHPEVQHLQEELKTARAAATAAQPTDSTRLSLIEADPTYQTLVAESNLTRVRIAGLQRTEKQLLADIARYQRRVDEAPMAEQAISSLQREYDLERENHKQLSEKHAAAVVQEQIARSRGGERFSVLYDASMPDGPESPNRPVIVAIGLALGLGLGGALAFAREWLDRSFREARDLENEFDVPVLVEIPRIRAAG